MKKFRCNDEEINRKQSRPEPTIDLPGNEANSDIKQEKTAFK
jgi:hypothetical protein